jgi:hypothetical protein
MAQKLICILFLLFCSTFLFGQTDIKIKSIRKEVEKINKDSSYDIKALLNDYFVDEKNEVSDGGQELRGFYKNGQLKKINHSVGISCCMNTTEFYFSGKDLVFVFEKQEVYPEVKDNSGELKIDYTRPGFRKQADMIFIQVLSCNPVD